MPIDAELVQRWTELHHLLSDPHECPEDEVLDAIEKHPEQAKVQHDGCFLPVHYAAALYGSKAVCQRLHEVYPQGTRAISHLGSLPLHLAAHNGRLDAVGVFLAAYPGAAELEDGWGFTPVDLAWRKGHWEVVDFLESQTGIEPKGQTGTGEVIAPFDPSTPLEADVFGQKYAAVFDVADPLSAEGDQGEAEIPLDASGQPQPGEAGWPLVEYEKQQRRWRLAVANRPERLALEVWVEQHPNSYLDKKLASKPSLASEWRQQISRHIKWMRAQGAEADKTAYAVYEAGQKRQEEKARQREVLLSQVPDEETGQQ